MSPPSQRLILLGMGLFLCVSCGNIRRQEREILRHDQCLILLEMSDTLAEKILSGTDNAPSPDSVQWFKQRYEECLKKHPVSQRP